MTLSERQQQLEATGRISGNSKDLFVRPYVKSLCPRAGDRILDVGAYMGANLFYFAELSFEAVGIEAAETFCRRFEEELVKRPQCNPKPVMIHQMFEEFQDPRPFQAILCGEVLCYTPDPSSMIAKCYQHLSPGGVALFTILKRRQKPYITHLELDVLKRMVEQEGFKIVMSDYLIGLGGTPVSAVRAIKEEKP